jgi:hypothetical protein
MSGGAASSAPDNGPAPDEKVVKDDLDKFVFYENDVATGARRNSLLCGDTVVLSAMLERRLCGPCFRLYHRAFVFCTMKVECNVCLEAGKIGLMYTCNGSHKVCIDCFKETRTNKAAFEKLKKCFLCRVGTIMGDLYDGVDPMA